MGIFDTINGIADDINDRIEGAVDGVTDKIGDFFGISRDDPAGDPTFGRPTRSSYHLRYPLANHHQYKATINFGTIQRPETDIKPVGRRVNQKSNIPPWAGGEYDTTDLNFEQINSQRGAGNETLEPIQPTPGLVQCTMYLPQTLNMSDMADYNRVALDRAGEVIRQATKAGTGALAAIVSEFANDNIMSDIYRMATNSAYTAGQYATLKLSQKMAPEYAAAGIKAGTRRALNPNFRAQFESVAVRYFDFTFKMIPTSQAEAEEVTAIIKFFRSRLYPVARQLQGIPTTYDFPDLFHLKIRYEDAQGVQTQLATRIKPCYLTNVDVVYNAGSMGIHYDGNFTEVDLSLKFMEETALNRFDVDQLGY